MKQGIETYLEPSRAQPRDKGSLVGPLALRQLDQVQSALERAKIVAVQDNSDGRFFFDYERATRDLKTMKQGIETYLEPSRAQPRDKGSLVG
ncbi:RAQPRD family integrative conjugative element protein, partial [Salmonella enterica]|uniref:integrative conjugative element protein, RAQPRD family n=1 Tax=Salmonella enterica TaxID=28901 RepID=UPI002618F5AE